MLNRFGYEYKEKSQASIPYGRPVWYLREMRYRLMMFKLWVKNLFRTRDRLIHEYLTLIDQADWFNGGLNQEQSPEQIADMLLEMSPQKAQEVYDEIIILGLAIHNEKGVLTLTESGKKRLYHSYYLKEHQNRVKRWITEFAAWLVTMVLAIGGLQTCKKTVDHSVIPLQNIDITLRGIDTSIRRLVPIDTIVVYDTVKVYDTIKSSRQGLSK